MGDQTRRSYHVSSHTVTDKEDNVFRLADFFQVSNKPLSCCLGPIVVRQGSGIFARLVQSNFSVCFASDFDQTWLPGVFSKQICDLYISLTSREGIE